MRTRGPGSTLAPGLEVVAHLRRGTDLDVYDAWDAARGCRVVVKALRPDRSDTSRAARRLRAEGRLLLRLAHPHLVRAYELRTAPRPLLVLETLPGHTVDALVEHDPLAPAEAAVLGHQVGTALAFLHAHDVVHLDVKPSNVVAVGGRAVLLDLSIARRAGTVAPGLGTDGFMSPEQETGGHVGPAADVWGLATLLRETLDGEGPLTPLLDAARAPAPADRPPLRDVLDELERVGGSPRAALASRR